jgi:hypothetical protein
MSENPSNDLFLFDSQKPHPFQVSQMTNSSLNILNKISAISVKNLSKNNSFELNELSFLDDLRQAPVSIIEETPLKTVKMNENQRKMPQNRFSKLEELIEEEPSNSKENHPLNNFKANSMFGEKEEINKGKGTNKTECNNNYIAAVENMGFPFSNKKNPSFNLSEKSTITKNDENFDFLVKDWGDYFYDDEPSKIKVLYIQ